METISNLASTATSTVSNLIYGQPAKANETGGQEPLSGEQGKGTAKEPFDQGNAANPVDTTSSTNTFSDTSKNDTLKSDDFLPLNPTLGKPTESATETKTGGTRETGMPIVPLNPDVATMGTGPTHTSTSQTGITDKTGVSDKVWKPTPLDEVTPSGAPGAGPSAPDFTPAVPEGYSGSSSTTKMYVGGVETYRDNSTTGGLTGLNETSTTGAHQDSSALGKETASHQDSPTLSKDTTIHQDSPALGKDSSSHQATGSSVPENKHSVSSNIDSIIHPTPKAEHSVDDAEAEAPHSKMTEHTVRHADVSKPTSGSEEPKSLVADNSAHHHESSKSHEPASPAVADDKDEKDAKKMSHLKEKLKNKLHIGSKDK